MANSKLTITDLPNDLLFEVFDRLTVKEVLSIRTVNKNFHLCSKKWFASVDELFIFDDAFSLQKSFGEKPFKMRDAEFEKDEQTLLPSIESMLSSFTGIQNIDFYLTCPSISVSQMIQLISRCPNFKRFSLRLENQFTDQDWTCLIQVIKQYDVYLHVWEQPPIMADHLKQLFTTATRIKSVRFQDSTDLFLKTIDLLDDSVRIEIIGCFSKTVGDKHISDLVARRVDSLETSLFSFRKLSCYRFSRLSSLQISSVKRIKNGRPFTSAIEFPRLQSLTVSFYRNAKLVSSFLTSAQRLDQLKKLEIISEKFVIKDKLLIDVLKKTPKLAELLLSWDYPGEFSLTQMPAFKKLLQSLSQASIRIPFVEVEMWLTKLEPDDFCLIIDCLFGFASKKITETKLKLTFCRIGEGRSEFKEKIPTTLPKNVQIDWLFD